MELKQKLVSLLPEAYYSDGTKSECALFCICNMFDVDSDSFKQVKEKRNMEDKQSTRKTCAKGAHINYSIESLSDLLS